MIRAAAVGVVVGVLVSAGSCIWAGDAPVVLAATIDVTITSDTTNGGDGEMSLREAIATANASAGGDTVVLGAAQAYTLADCLNGPLRYDEDETLVIQGNGSSITQTCDAEQLLRSQAMASSMELHDLHLIGGPNAGAVAVDGMAIEAGSVGTIGLFGVEISGFDAGAGTLVRSGSGHGTTPYFVTVADSNLHDNSGTAISGDNPSVLVQDSTIADNVGTAIGLVDGYPLVVDGSVVTGNSGSGLSTTGQGFPVNATTITGSTISDNGRVGVSCSQCGSLTITGSTISGNGITSPSVRRGGVWMAIGQRSTMQGSLLTIADSTITGNHSEEGGGGVNAFVNFIEQPTSLPPLTTITGGVIDGNDTTLDGGGVSVAAGTLVIDGTTITNNTAAGDGGGLTSGDATGPYDLSIIGAIITGNTAGDDGGGVHAGDTVAASITTSTVASNTAIARGGGIFANTMSLGVDGSRITTNGSAEGGGIWYAGDGLGVRRSTLDGNTAAGDGGGVFADVVGPVVLENVTAVGNAAARGGAVAVAAGGTTLDHVTASSNTAPTGAHIWQGAGTTALTRSALVSPSSASCSSAAATTGWSFLADASCGSSGTDVVSAADPQLGPLTDNGGLTPTLLPAPTSPLGGRVPLASCLTVTDQRGTARPQGAACDAGAVEFAEAPMVAPIMGTSGGDVLIGTSGDDTILALAGHDIVFGRGGADRIEGGPGRDVLVGGAGADHLLGGPGRDVLIAGPGDVADGGPGIDLCFMPGAYFPVDC